MSWQDFVSPSEHAAYDKHDVIDWAHLPTGQFEMNYRVPTQVSTHTGVHALATTAIATLLGVGLWVAMRCFDGYVGSLLLAAVIAGGFTYLRKRSVSESVWLLLLPIAMVALTALSASGASRHESIVAWLLCLGCGAIGIADQVATTNLWWCSANPRTPCKTLTAYRKAWEDRWLGGTPEPPKLKDPDRAIRRRMLLQMGRNYHHGAAWFGLPLALGVVVGLFLSKATGAGLPLMAIVGEATLLLACAAWLRLQGYSSGAVTTLFMAFSRHLSQQSPTPAPPWVLQLPGGEAHERWLKVHSVALASGFVATPLLLAELFASPIGWASVLMLLLFTPVAIALAIAIHAGPTILSHHVAFEQPGCEQEEVSDWDGYVARLRESRRAEERHVVWNGNQCETGFPMLVDRKLRYEHTHVVGATGSAKTAQSIVSDLIQLTRHNQGEQRAGANIIIDCKGDMALLHTAKAEAEAAGRRFKWFTNRHGLETYAFNPLMEFEKAGLSIAERVTTLAQALSLYHGEGYGRSFFGSTLMAALRTAFASATASPGSVASRPPIHSFLELADALSEELQSEQERQQAKHLLDTLSTLVSYPQLNVTAGDEAAAHEHAIDLQQAIADGDVVYFYLTGVLDVASVGHIARLALYAVIAAAAAHYARTGQRADVQIFADEAQCLVGKSVEVILEQARSLGVACLLAHQNLSQLDQPGSGDMRQLVQANTAVKRYHTARDPETQKYLSAVSGRTRYVDLSWDQNKSRVSDGQLHPRYAAGRPLNKTLVVSQVLGDRIEAQDISDMNRRIEQSVLLVERSEGLTQLNGPVVVEAEFPVDFQTYNDRGEQPWPTRPGQTLVAPAPAYEPQPSSAVDDDEIRKRLEEFRNELDDEDDKKPNI